MRLHRPLVVALALSLAACAASVKRPPASGAASVDVPAAAARRIVLNLSGDRESTGARDWEAFKGEWRAAFKAKAAAEGLDFEVQDGPVRAGAGNGTLLAVHIVEYRYMTSGARYGLGIFAGNAFIDARIRFLDARTGAPFGEQAYNTSSTAWQGIFSAMTDKQVQAIAAEVIRDVKRR